MPAISIVIPTYNRAALVPLAINSLLAQTQRATEIIVVDNGSVDDTPAVLRGFGDAIKVVRLDPNAGLVGARNAGIEAATQEWIGFLDDDDEYGPERLRITAESIERFPAAQVHATNTAIVTEGGSAPEVDLFQFRGLTGQHFMPLDRPISWILRGCFFAQTIICRRALIHEVGRFRPTLYEDLDLGVRLAQRTPWIVDSRPSFRLMRRNNTPVLSHDWRNRPIERGEALVRIHREALAFAGHNAQELRQIKTGLATYLFELGKANLERKEPAQARRCFAEAARTFPLLHSRIKAAAALAGGRPALQLMDRLRRHKAVDIR